MRLVHLTGFVATAMVAVIGVSGCASVTPENADAAEPAMGTQDEPTSSMVAYPSPLLSSRDQDSAREHPQRAFSIEELQGCLAFQLELPTETFGLTRSDLPWDADTFRDAYESHDGTMSVLWYGDDADRYAVQLNESLEDSAADAQALIRGILPSLAFDDRYMVRMNVDGYEAIAWSPIEEHEPSTNADGSFRPGMTVRSSGVVWTEGPMLYTILSGRLNRDQLLQMAESLQRPPSN